jgi:hypothetical protein
MKPESKLSAWQSKVLDEPRMGFVEEVLARAKEAARLHAERLLPPPAPPEIKKPAPLEKILNEGRIGFLARLTRK